VKPKSRILWALLTCMITAVTDRTVTGQATAVVERYSVFEASFRARPSENGLMESLFSAVFTQGGRSMSVPGFWDGGSTFKIRFSPPTVGRWTFKTTSSEPGLNGRTGAFTVVEPSDGNHGPVEIFETFYLRYADAAPYHQYGTTCYAWIHQPEAMQEQTLRTLASSPFNKIRFCIFPKNYTYNENEPKFFAFKKNANGKFDFAQPDIAFWRHLEKRILDLQKLGIEADVILWHPYDRWGFADMSDAEDDRYLRYCIARLAAFRNVWWSLANEFDFMTNQPKNRRGNKQLEDWDRFFSIIDKEDPFRRMRGIHNGRIWYDHTKDWVIHASLQTSDMNGGVRYRGEYQKPVIYDECKYEGNIPQGWGNLTAREMTQRFWLGTMSGCYVGHGETYKHPEDLLWWAKGGVLHGDSPKRIQWLKEFMNSAPPFNELAPLGDDQGRFMLGKEREYYLLYCLAGQTQEVELPGDRPYKIDARDPWEMTQWPAGSLISNSFTATAPEHDLVFRFTPYAPGETLRPEAKPTASVTEGVPSLTVQFKSNTQHRVAWDFDDGKNVNERDPTHTFEQPGRYNVALTVTDDHGSSARGNVVILVDRDWSEPIVRAGFGDRDQPKMNEHGTAKRQKDGGWLLAEHAPFGRFETPAEVSEELGGLRSFTIAGWLQPERLIVGSGGNRILFCLQRNKAGIDLVHLDDGRMRLSVNEWPDRVKNDSSPGRLVVGKWTYFAVTYDAASSQDNVAWYFSEPSPLPVDNATIRLDRKNTYKAGAVANRVGGLAIGNFNRTMQSYGWDRQFRGTIKGLVVFGSRISGRGALDLNHLQNDRE
jgi:hypothetical protein